MSKKILLLLFVALCCTLYCVEEQWFIYDIDDYAFSTITELPGVDGTSLTHTRPVDSMGDAIESQVACYQIYNGRFLIHGITQWLCGTQPAWVVVLINTIAWGLLIVCMSLLCCGGMRSLTLSRLTIVLCTIWLLMPSSAKMFLGSVTGAADYLWGSAITMLFLVVYYKFSSMEHGNPSRFVVLLLVLLAFIAGTIQESFSIGISAGLIVHALVNRHHQGNVSRMMIAGYVVGTMVCCLAPANFSRADMMGHHLHVEALIDAAKIPVFSFMVIALVVAWVVNRSIVKYVIREHLVAVVAIVVNLAFAFLVAYTSSWQLTCVAMCSTIVLLQLVFRLLDAKRWIISCAAIVLALGTAGIAWTQYNYRRHMWAIEQRMFSQALAPGDGLISLSEAFEADRSYMQSPLAPFYRLYTSNFARALINDNQRCCNSMLSKFLTNCSNPSLVKGLLPATASEIEHMLDASTTRENGVTVVRCEDYVISRQELMSHESPLEPNREYDYNGKRYYIYHALSHGL